MKLALVHYQPVEYYPPVTNFLTYLDLDIKDEITVYTTENTKGIKPAAFKNIKILRSAGIGQESSLKRFFKYVSFNLVTFLKLCYFHPDFLLYYESYSAMPVFLYMRIFGKKTKLGIHFHEYFPQDWYNTGMQTVKYYHKLEKSYLFPQSVFISQTNSKRKEMFVKDQPSLDASKILIFPNYPLKHWSRCIEQKEWNTTRPHKFVYIGAVSLYATYIKEFCTWIINHPQELLFDIYAHSYDQETYNYLKQFKGKRIRFFSNGIPYKDIPQTIKDNHYQTGVILYKCLDQNYVYNAPNKLFEYLNCNLDVWYPMEMKGTAPYQNSTSIPRIIEIDYSSLHNSTFNKTKNRQDLPYKSKYNYAEETYLNMYNAILNN